MLGHQNNDAPQASWLSVQAASDHAPAVGCSIIGTPCSCKKPC